MPHSALPSHIDGFDLAAGLHRVGGNAAFYLSLLRKFSHSYAAVPSQIGAALEAGDWATAERLAHSVRGVAGTLGADGLHIVASTLQMAIKEQLPRTALDQHLAEFAETLAATIDALDRSQSDSGPG